MSFSNQGRLHQQVRFLRRQFLQDGELPFSDVLSEGTVTQALNALNVAWLDRVYSPLVTLWVFLGQVLSADHSCRSAVARLIAHRVSQGQSPCSAETGAYCQARKRLPEQFFSTVACLVGRALEAKVDRRWLWKGRRVYMFDGTTVTMAAAFRRRGELGSWFDAMQHLAVRWALVRALRDHANHLVDNARRWNKVRSPEQPEMGAAEQIRAERKGLSAEHRRLVEDFVAERIEPISLRDAARRAEEEHARIHELQFPAARRAGDAESGEAGRVGRRRRLKIKEERLDAAVLQAAFAWLDVTTATTPAERRAVLNRIREFNELILAALPPRQDGADAMEGHPSEFDGWVQSVVCRTIVQLGPSEEPDSLWQPTLALGAFAHAWVEHFFWQWFTDGVQAAPTPKRFVDNWVKMIRFALAAEGWDETKVSAFDLDDMVYELLGFHFGEASVADDGGFASLLPAHRALLDQTAARWFGWGRVAKGFARSVVRPAYAQMLASGVRWLHRAAADERFWDESGLEDALVHVLAECWRRSRGEIANDRELREAFNGLLTLLASRGNHAAMALREQIVNSIGGNK